MLTGVDANEAALALARDKRLRTSTGDAQFVEGDAYALAESLGRFDAAFVGFFWILDNHYVEGNSTPIACVDADGNAWQERPLFDETMHRVLKNFPGRENLMDQLAHRATSTHWWRLDYYWQFEYRLA